MTTRKVFRKPLILLPMLLVLISITYIACKRTAEAVGPAYYSAPAGFTPILNIPDSTINFKVKSLAPSNNLGSKVTWTLTYKGLTSGATKTFSGSSDVIDQSNALWNGGHDGIYFFKTGEKVEATLSFLGTNYVTTDYVRVITPRDYTVGNPNLVAVGVNYATNKANNGYENGSEIGFSNQFAFGSGRPHCYDPDPAKAPFARPVKGTFIEAVEGNYYFKMKGVSYDADGYFIAGLQHRKAGFFFPTWTDPDKIYFNVYIYGQGNSGQEDSTINTIFNLEFHEADLSNNASKPKNECGVSNAQLINACALIGKNEHDPCTDDGWVYQIPVTHTGWKLFSVQYSKFTPSPSAVNGGSGNKIMEPSRVARIQVGIVSTPAHAVGYGIFDYPVITYGAPFDPNN